MTSNRLDPRVRCATLGFDVQRLRRTEQGEEIDDRYIAD
jgi:hypothetical protein